MNTSYFYQLVCKTVESASFSTIQTIKAGAFRNCDLLSYVSFPACKSISTYAFQGCGNLSTVNFPLCTSIGSFAFEECNLIDAVFPACISTGSNAFRSCSWLTSISLPLLSSVTMYTFVWCSALQELSLPSCKGIGSYAFSACFRLVSLYLKSSSIVSLYHSNAFMSTPMLGYSTSTMEYYGYVVAATKRYGLKCTQLNGASIYGNSTSTYHAQAKAAIEAGDLVIACMGRGTWTSSGHFVTVWDIRGNTIYINDPASSRLARTQGDYSTFKKQVKYYWVIKNPGKTTVTTKTVNYIVKITDKTGLNCRNGAGTGYSIIKTYPYGTGVSITKETSTGWGYTGEGWINLTNTEKVPVNTETVVKEDELDMTKEAFIASLSNAEAYELLSKALNHMSTLAEPTWSKSEGGFQAAVDKGVINGGAPERLVRRDEMTAVLKRLGLL